MKSRGFTLIEILIALAVLSLAMGISVPTYKAAVEKSNTNVCALNRETLSGTESTFFLIEGRHSSGTQELVDLAYLKNVKECPEGFAYTWKKVDGTDYNYLLVATCPKHNMLEIPNSFGNIILSTKYLDMYDSGVLLSKLSELKYIPDYSTNSVKVKLASGTEIETDDLGSATVKFTDGAIRYIGNIYNSWQYLKSDFNYSQDRMEYSGDYMYVGYGFAGEGKYEHEYLDYEYNHDRETGSYDYRGVSNYSGTYSGASLKTDYGYIAEGTYQTNEPYKFSYTYNTEDDGSYSGAVNTRIIFPGSIITGIT